MKNLIFLLAAMFSLSLHANIEYVESERSRPSLTEVAQSRACFAQLSEQGCGDPGDDMSHFRLCMHDSYSKLSEDCKKLMSDLYKNR